MCVLVDLYRRFDSGHQCVWFKNVLNTGNFLCVIGLPYLCFAGISRNYYVFFGSTVYKVLKFELLSIRLDYKISMTYVTLKD